MRSWLDEWSVGKWMAFICLLLLVFIWLGAHL
jgi:hypothetical protein